MRVRRFRWWHGCVAGLLVGAALWRADVAIDGWEEPRVVTGMSVEQFTRLVSAGAAAVGARPAVEDLRIYPPADGKHLVTGRARVARWNGATDGSFEFVAPVPFVVPAYPSSETGSGLGGLALRLFGARAEAAPAVKPRTYPTVRDYLAEVAPSLNYRYLWWEEPRARAGLWMGGATVAMGVVLPGILAVLVRAGLLSRPEEEPMEVAAERLGGEDPAPARPPVDMAAVDAQLAAVLENVEQKLTEAKQGADSEAPGGVDVAPGAGAAAARPVVLGPGEEVQAASVSVEEKVYDRGEFYPVSRGHPEKPQKPAE